jgi:hypothetical protein
MTLNLELGTLNCPAGLKFRPDSGILFCAEEAVKINGGSS